MRPTQFKTKGFWAFALIFLLSSLLRLGVAAVNRQANDEHFEAVIHPLLLDKPVRNVLYRYHPKLYHRTVVTLVRLFRVENPERQLVLAQGVSALAGIAAMAVLWAFLAMLPTSPAIRIVVYLWFAFNPGLVAISGQATNDTFILLFSLGATLCLWRLFAGPSRLWLGGELICLAAAVASKGNGLVLAAAAFVILLGKRRFTEAALVLLVTLGTARFCGVYFSYSTYKKLALSESLTAGNPFGLTQANVVPVTSETGRTLLATGFLTLPVFDLFLHPYNDFPPIWDEFVAGKVAYPHMRSYWTQFYGNATYSRFHDWPTSWRTRAPWSVPLARALHLLNLLPLFLFFLGMGLLARKKSGWPALVILGAFLLAGLRYFMLYPIFPFAKFIYLAPAAAAAAVALERGWAYAGERLSRRAISLLLAMTLLLFALDVIDVLWLIADLAKA